MIQKIMPKLSTKILPNRSTLQKASTAGLLLMAGSSMSGWHSPSCITVEKIIPGGLSFKEKAYYLLKGKLPSSVYDRWVPNSPDYVPQNGDQVVSVNLYEGRYIGDIVEAPHGIDTIAKPNETLNVDISNEITSAASGDITGIDSQDDSEVSAFEIWKHLAGFQD